jgi:type I restriction enzyme S subunit
MSKELPNDWKFSTIPYIVGKNGIFADGDWIESKDQDLNGDVRLIQLADIGDGNFRNKSSRFLTTKRAREINCTFLSEGDILVARMPDPIGRACIFPLKGLDKYVTAVDVAIIRPDDEKVDKKYLLYAINNPKFRNEIENLQSGTTRKRISRKNLSIIEFPLPPKPTQLALVSKIEELFSEIENGIKSLFTAQQQLKTYRQSVLKWAFEGKLTNSLNYDSYDLPVEHDLNIAAEPETEYVVERNDSSDIGKLPEGWKWVQIKDVAETYGGYAFKSGDFKKAGKYQVLRMGNIRPGILRYDESPVFLDEVNESVLSRSLLQSNDVIITQTGTRKKRDYGFTVLIPKTNLLLNQRIAAMRFKENYLPKFFLYFSWTDSFKDQFFANETGNVGQGNVGMKAVTETLLPFCSIKEQNVIVEEIESRLSVADKMEESINQSLQQAEALKQSILKKAFEGKLT